MLAAKAAVFAGVASLTGLAASLVPQPWKWNSPPGPTEGYGAGRQVVPEFLPRVPVPKMTHSRNRIESAHLRLSLVSDTTPSSRPDICPRADMSGPPIRPRRRGSSARHTGCSRTRPVVTLGNQAGFAAPAKSGQLALSVLCLVFPSDPLSRQASFLSGLSVLSDRVALRGTAPAERNGLLVVSRWHHCGRVRCRQRSPQQY